MINYLITGISLGSIYAIIALGYTMVYGIAKMLNFAHGDIIIVCTVLGVVIERTAYKPLRSAPALAVLITAIGVSYFLQNAALLIWSANPVSFTSVVGMGAIEVGGLRISHVTLVTIVACLIIMAALMLFTSKSKMGTAMRAVSEDKGAAQLMGINVNTTLWAPCLVSRHLPPRCSAVSALFPAHFWAVFCWV